MHSDGTRNEDGKHNELFHAGGIVGWNGIQTAKARMEPARPVVLQLFEAAQDVEDSHHDAALVKVDRLPARRYAWRVDRDEILCVLRAFEESGLDYVLIGATAMGFHGVVRATEDIDLFIRATADNVERLRAALKVAYAGDPLIDDISAVDLLGDYPAVRYYPPSGDLYFDILTRLGDAATFDTVEVETKTVEGVLVQVATPAALYRLKKNTVRAKDHQDAAALRERFNLTDEDE